jgi:hypothetical protein
VVVSFDTKPMGRCLGSLGASQWNSARQTKRRRSTETIPKYTRRVRRMITSIKRIYKDWRRMDRNVQLQPAAQKQWIRSYQILVKIIYLTKWSTVFCTRASVCITDFQTTYDSCDVLHRVCEPINFEHSCYSMCVTSFE